MFRKAVLRVTDRDSGKESALSAAWCRQKQIDAAQWATAIDPKLWKEAQAFAREQEEIAQRLEAERGEKVGGGGFYALLYFLTRRLKPKTVVETGVAFGFSSRAFLKALNKNRSGKLFSSDFPYFRHANPEKLVGLLVEPELRGPWTLLIGSDRENLPKIAADATRIDLLHYDSDKSRAGRDFALETLGRKLSDDAVIVFDDIQNNLHFRDWVASTKAPFLVFLFKGKWLGMTGGPADLCLKTA